MAFNWQTFRTRALTAVVFAAVMLLGLFWNAWSFFILFSIIHFGCWWEYLRLLEKIHQATFHPNLKLGFMLTGYGFMLLFCGNQLNIEGYTIRENLSLPFSVAGILLMMIGNFQTTRIKVPLIGSAFLGIVYISLSWGLMMHLFREWNVIINETPVRVPQNFFPVAIIFTIWINDTMAYIVGSLIGKRPLTPISPKKTWEGTVGGILLSVVLVSLLFPFVHMKSHPGLSFSLMLMVISLVAAVAGTFGDLLESKLKRMAGVKDSGQIMPGHGGFLDRFDSLVVAVPCVWLVLRFFVS